MEHLDTKRNELISALSNFIRLKQLEPVGGIAKEYSD